CIWARYSMVITPKNWNLFSVNIFVGATGIFQLIRIYRYRQSQKMLAVATSTDKESINEVSTPSQ
ncbi:mitochondrial pyruvate carrier 2-like, partial [Saccoglossus kowalevskii]